VDAVTAFRIFISHTSELREFPRGRSYVSEVERAINAAGHVVVDMADFPAADLPPASLCEERVRGCDVYVGVLGTRYGSPVRDRPEVSYTELEFDVATRAGLDRLVFVLDPDAENVSIPPKHLMDREFGDRQDAFRRRVRELGLTTQSFAEPARLGQLVERSLRELADTRRRISSGIQREQVPAEPQPVRGSKFVNPPPAVAPSWFQGRQVETERLAGYLADPGIRMVTVVGRGGIGKTAMVCRLLKELEAGRIAVGGIVYLSHNGVHPVEYSTLIEDLLRLLPAEVAQQLHRRYQDAHHSPREMMLALLEAFPVDDPVVLLLDNLESVMDAERETLVEPALREALTALLAGPAHAVTAIVTTRVTPTELLKMEPAGQRQLRLDAGLGSPDAENVLRSLDDDGHLGLRDAPDELLDGLRRHTRGFPRALEAVKAILDGDGTLSPRDLLNRTGRLSEDQVVQVLVGEAYELLDLPAQRVMQALSVYPGPVSPVAVDFLISPANPTVNAAPILARLVRRRLVRFHEGSYYLHPVDRDYASGQLSVGSSEFSLAGLRARAADYYVQTRTPRDSWRSLDDVRPQLAEFELRCDTGDYDSAAWVLADIDYDYLGLWGYHRLLVDLHSRIHERIHDSFVNGTHLTDFGLSYYNLGDYRRAIDLHKQALIINREIDHRPGEAANLNDLGSSHYRMGEYRLARDLRTDALTINREIGNRRGEVSNLSNLALVHQHLGDFYRALELLTQGLVVTRDLVDRGAEASSLSNLGLCHHRLGDHQRAIDLYEQSLVIVRAIGYSRLEGYVLGNLGLSHGELGRHRKAIDLHIRAVAIAREISDPHGEANALGYLGRVRLDAGDEHLAAQSLEKAILLADGRNDIEPAAEARSWLARVRLQMDDPAAALALTTAARDLRYLLEQPTLSMLRGLALLGLERAEEAVAAFEDALAAAADLLALADRNVLALQARAVALYGLAATTGEESYAVQAERALAEPLINSPGMVLDTKRLLTRIPRL
jgi:tetratricopeptide (TPR) repeat protein